MSIYTFKYFLVCQSLVRRCFQSQHHVWIIISGFNLNIYKAGFNINYLYRYYIV